MRLSALAAVCEGCKVHGPGDPEITRVDYDSRQVLPGSLFMAIEGAKSDGHRFLQEAFSRGAAAAAVRRLPDELKSKTFLLVEDSRRALALMAGELAGHPDRLMDLVAVTGTNGKSTIAFLLQEVLTRARGSAGLIGTIGACISPSQEEWQKQDRTTPEAPDIYHLLLKMRHEGCTGAVLEVSSHALALRRVWGMKFKVAAFTNLTQDHLDFHGDLETYYKVKAGLFIDYDVGTAVINKDDPYGQRLIKATRVPVMTYGLKPSAEVTASSLKLTVNGTIFTAHTLKGDLEVSSPLVGRFNVYNLLCALAVAEVLGVSHGDFVTSMASFGGVPGRMERFDLGDRWAYVDYAHTPDALERVLLELKRLVGGPLQVLFGCGGNRDRAKRPLMGAAAEMVANRVYITTDNPRDEEPEAIAAEILGGMSKPKRAVKILDRRQAIRTALEELPPGGVLLIAGKGHETYQEVKGVRLPFDDRLEVRRHLSGSSV